LNSSIAILNLVQDELEQVEQTMREDPRLPGLSTLDTRGSAASGTPSPILNSVIDHLVDSGGKRVRPALALLVSRVYPADRERIVALAAAIELLHTATLVHDDLIDGALLRRGNPTLDACWSS